MNQAVKQYLKEIKKQLPCSASQKKRYMEHITDSVSDYVGQHSDCNFEELCKAFGTPEEIADAYISDLSADEFSKKTSTKKVVLVSIVLGVILVGVVAFASVQIAIAKSDLANGYYYHVVYELPSDAPSELPVYGEY